MLTETWKIKGKDRDTEKNIEKEAEGWRDTNRQTRRHPPPWPGRELDTERLGEGGPGGSRVLISGQRWVDTQRTATGLSDRDKGKQLMQPAVHLPGRELEKWSRQEHGTGCWGQTKPYCSKALSPQCLGLHHSPGQGRVPAW